MSDVSRLEASHLNKSQPIIVYLHGFSERAPGGKGQSSEELRDGKLIYILFFFTLSLKYGTTYIYYIYYAHSKID